MMTQRISGTWLRLLGTVALVGVALGMVPEPVTAQRGETGAYARGSAWLCRPDRLDDACGRSDQDATVLRPGGATSVERFRRDPTAPIDCFYVYPTVSTDPAGNAPLVRTKAETAAINQQFARFASVCRPFAPLYRQVTLAALHASMAGKPIATDREMAYADVLAAWRWYLGHDNHGRGVVLIGHSQGSALLARLIRQEIDGKPAQRLLVSAILAGYRLQVPVGGVVGGEFRTVPLCAVVGQSGCVVTFASFRADAPPPDGSSAFGASAGPGLEAACVDPAALGGGEAPLHAYLGSGFEMVTASGERQGPWTTPPTQVATPFVEVPGMLTGECRRDHRHHYLAVTIHPDPSGVRTDAIVGDVVIGGRRLPDWGLHRVDMNLVMGDLISTVRAQKKAWVAAGR